MYMSAAILAAMIGQGYPHMNVFAGCLAVATWRLAGLAALAGVEVHAISPEGKLIVTIETDDDGSNVATYERIGQLDGVMSAAMVYHQTESEPFKEI